MTTDKLKWLADQGATFALPKGRTKDKFETDWPNKPHCLAEASAHAKRGGNVGILTGKHSNNIVALDRDIDFPGTVAMMGNWGETAKIIRSNAPDRGKLLYQVLGSLPDSTVYKPNGEKHPHAELLANGRHALGPTSQYNGGDYILQDAELGIMEVTPAELDYIWWSITSQHCYPEFAPKEPEHGDTTQTSKEYVQAVKDAWSTIDVFNHFQKDSNGTEERKGQTRILGNGGLDVRQ